MLNDVLLAILKEPPIRRFVKTFIRALPVSVPLKALWDAVDRPHYLWGVLAAAEQAQRQGLPAITVIEFGVAEGHGLLALERHARAVENHTGVRIEVCGFDTATGLPKGTGDYRDHPDIWKAGDYQMNESQLRSRLYRNTTLVIGDLAVTALAHQFGAPLGFVVFDLDLYSSTSVALRILLRHDVLLLRRVALYFDDINAVYNHRFAGELLAIEEFNRASQSVKLERWRGIQRGRPFPEADWLSGMYVAHNFDAISQAALARGPARMR